MATIPVSITNEQETAAPPNLYQRPVADANTFGAGFGKALGGFAESLMRLQAEKQADADSTAALEAYNKASIEKARVLYDPDNGLYTRQGSNVGSIYEDFDKANSSIGENSSAGLSPEAKKKFDQMWSRSSLADREGVMKHEFAERMKYRAATGNATVDLAVSNAINGYANPDVISRSKSEVLGAVMQTFPGASKQTIAEKVMEGYSAIHKGVIFKLSAESPSQAEQYFNSVRDEITGADNVQITNHLRQHIFRTKVLEDAERITKGNGPVRELYRTLYEGNPEGRALAEAVTQQESGFGTKVRAYNKTRGVVNPEKTAVGLTQVLTGTAREISADLKDGLITPGMKPDEIEKLLEQPALNIKYGMYYLSKQLKRYGGDLEAALIAYNAGPGNADKWLRAGRDYAVLPDRQQTEPYVRNVTAMYRRNLGGNFPKTAANLDAAGVVPAATDAQINAFRNTFDPAKVQSMALTPDVENGAAALFDGMPEIVKTGIQMTSVGGDLAIDTKDSFSREWILFNAPTVGLVVNESEAGVTLTAGKGPSNTGLMVEQDEYNLNDWLKEADKIEDPARREAVTQEIMRRHSALQRAAKQDEDSLKQQAWSMVLDNQEVPIDLQKKLDPSYMSSLREYQRKMATEGRIVTDWAVWANLRMMTPEQLAALGDVMAYRPKLGDTEFKTLVDMVREARNEGEPGKKGLLGAIRTRTQIVSDTLRANFRNKPEAIGKINSELDREIETYFDLYKKVPDAKQIQEMVDRMVMRVDTADSYFDSYLYEVQPGQRITDTLVSSTTDIPRENRENLLVNSATIFGRPLTEEEALWAYTAAIVSKRGATVRTPAGIRARLQQLGVPPERMEEAFGRLSAKALGIN